MATLLKRLASFAIDTSSALASAAAPSSISAKRSFMYGIKPTSDIEPPLSISYRSSSFDIASTSLRRFSLICDVMLSSTIVRSLPQNRCPLRPVSTEPIYCQARCTDHVSTTTWQLFRSFLHERRMIQRATACLLRDSPGVIRGKILRILAQLCKSRHGAEEAINHHCHLDLLWTYRESRQAYR